MADCLAAERAVPRGKEMVGILKIDVAVDQNPLLYSLRVKTQ